MYKKSCLIFGMALFIRVRSVWFHLNMTFQSFSYCLYNGMYEQFGQTKRVLYLCRCKEGKHEKNQTRHQDAIYRMAMCGMPA